MTPAAETVEYWKRQSQIWEDEARGQHQTSRSLGDKIAKLEGMLKASLADPLRRIAAERRRQETLWGRQDHDDFKYLSILFEEVGEAAQAANDKVYKHNPDERSAAAKNLPVELIQIAAVAVAMFEAIERRESGANS